MKTRVKLFKEDSFTALESAINKYLEQYPGLDVVDIKYQSYNCGGSRYTAMIIYKV